MNTELEIIRYGLHTTYCNLKCDRDIIEDEIMELEKDRAKITNNMNSISQSIGEIKKLEKEE